MSIFPGAPELKNKEKAQYGRQDYPDFAREAPGSGTVTTDTTFLHSPPPPIVYGFSSVLWPSGLEGVQHAQSKCPKLPRLPCFAVVAELGVSDLDPD